MGFKRRLGDFVREFKYEGATFFVRGLTVGEYADLAAQNLLKMGNSLYMEVGHCGLLGWENLYAEDEDGNLSKFEYKEHMDGDWLDEKTLSNIGKHIYHELTTLSDEDASKLRGFIRFLYWSSDEGNRNQLKSFDCDNCLESGMAVNRPCGEYSMEHRRSYLEKRRAKAVAAAQEAAQVAAKRVKGRKAYGNDKLRRQRKRRRHDRQKRAEEEAKQNTELKGPKGRQGFIMVGGYRYPECPVSWIDEWVKVVGEAMYHAEKSDMPFFSGGIADQPYQIFRASKVVKSEYGAVEHEEMEKERNK